MANTVTLKRSSVAGKIPQVTDLAFGEVALNFADGRLYFRNSNNEIEFFQTPSEQESFGILNSDLDLGLVTGPSTQTLDLGSLTEAANDTYDFGYVVVNGVVFPNTLILPSTTVSELSTGTLGEVVLVTDDINGAVPAFFDGNNWRRLSDYQVIEDSYVSDGYVNDGYA